MHRNGIRTRNELCKRIGVSSETICRVFDEQWQGVATKTVLAQIAGTFKVPTDYLIVVAPVRKTDDRHVRKMDSDSAPC